ncbi:MAG: hypothetical protein ACREBU_06855 [Nitrososphaera sp.]
MAIPIIAAGLIAATRALPAAGRLGGLAGRFGSRAGRVLRDPRFQAGAIGAGLTAPLLLPSGGGPDLTPGVPGGEVRQVHRRDILFDQNGRPVKVVSLGAKIQRRRRFRGRGGLSASKVASMIHEQGQQNMLFALMMARR